MARDKKQAVLPLILALGATGALWTARKVMPTHTSEVKPLPLQLERFRADGRLLDVQEE